MKYAKFCTSPSDSIEPCCTCRDRQPPMIKVPLLAAAHSREHVVHQVTGKEQNLPTGHADSLSSSLFRCQLISGVVSMYPDGKNRSKVIRRETTGRRRWWQKHCRLHIAALIDEGDQRGVINMDLSSLECPCSILPEILSAWNAV